MYFRTASFYFLKYQISFQIVEYILLNSWSIPDQESVSPPTPKHG